MVDFEVQGEQTFRNRLAEVEDPTFVNTVMSPWLSLVLLSISRAWNVDFLRFICTDIDEPLFSS